MHPFVRATTFEAQGEGRFAGRVDQSWFQARGAYGGVVAGTLARCFEAVVGDPHRRLRSLTVHCAAPLLEGEARVEARLERTGKYVAHLSGRLLQEGAVGLATATFGLGRSDVPAYVSARMPAAPAPETVAPAPVDNPLAPPFAKHFEYRYALGGIPWSGSTSPEGGGWIRPREPAPLDAAMALALLDAWPPVAMARTTEAVVSATVDFNFTFFDRFESGATAGPAHHLVHLHSRWAGDGYAEELRSLWSPEGTLLAQCRQLLALRPLG